MEDQITHWQGSDPTLEYVGPELTTVAVPRIRTRESQEAKVGRLVTRRSFLLKSAGALGGVALGVYLAPSLNTLRVPSVHAQVSPCPTSISQPSSSPGGTNSDTVSACTTTSDSASVSDGHTK